MRSSAQQQGRSAPDPAQEAPGARGTFALLVVLMGLSGCAALIYEIVWLQLLQLVISSSAVSLGLLLAAYMGGLCPGSVLLVPLVSPARHPLRVYAALEAGIGVFGLLALLGIPVVSRIYLAGSTGLAARALVAAVCLLPPTVLMGGSLPAIARWAGTSPSGISRMGFLYSASIAGGVAGSLIAGFYLLRVYDMAVATYAAVAINAVVSVCALLLASAAIAAGPEGAGSRFRIGVSELYALSSGSGAMLVYLASALSGLTALGAEVVWTRLLSLLLGPTVYTFSIILAVFLLGLWAGSSAGSSLVRGLERPRLALAACQILLAAAPGPATPWRILCPIGRWTPGYRSIHGSTSS